VALLEYHGLTPVTSAKLPVSRPPKCADVPIRPSHIASNHQQPAEPRFAGPARSGPSRLASPLV